MKRLILPTTLFLHELFLVALPIGVLTYNVLSQPTLYDGSALRAVTEHGPWYSAIFCCLIFTAVLQIILTATRLFISVKSFSSLYVRTLTFRYFSLFCLTFVLFDASLLSTRGLAKLSETRSSVSSETAARVSTTIHGLGSDSVDSTIAVRKDGSIARSEFPLIVPSWAFAVYFLLAAYFYRASAIERKLRLQIPENDISAF